MSRRKRQDSNRFYLLVAVTLVVGIGLITLASMSGNRQALPNEAVIGAGGIDLSTGYSLGAEDAPVVIAEWSDYQCPFCSMAATTTFPQLKEAYIDTGKVRYISKDFPLGMHPQAAPAAEYVNCAIDQGKYWELRHEVFARQQEWSGHRDFLQKIESFAAAVGLDTDAMNSCFKAAEKRAEIQGTKREGERLGITGTPTMFVNGRMIGGAIGFEDLQQIIEEELANVAQ